MDFQNLHIFVYKSRKKVVTIYLSAVKPSDVKKVKARILSNYKKKNFILAYSHSNNKSFIELLNRNIEVEGERYLQVTVSKSHISLYGGNVNSIKCYH